MIGGSYDGTTATMTAVRGRAVPALRRSCRSWGSAAGTATPTATACATCNSEVPSDEGFDTPLAFDFGFARTPPSDPTDPS